MPRLPAIAALFAALFGWVALASATPQTGVPVERGWAPADVAAWTLPTQRADVDDAVPIVEETEPEPDFDAGDTTPRAINRRPSGPATWLLLVSRDPAPDGSGEFPQVHRLISWRARATGARGPPAG